jgi:peptidoglycan/xylan/chitin deacetylase (PgdA/CDA1 family)
MSPAGMGGRLSVLVFHRVLVQADPLLPDDLDAAEFEQLMAWIKRTFSVIPLEEGAAGLKSGRLPARALSITFDDGYANNESVAAPILTRLGLHATFFIATGYLDGGRMFNDTVIEAVRGVRATELDLRPLGLGVYRTSSTSERVQAIGQILSAVKYRPPAERVELTERIAEIAAVDLPADLMMTSAQAMNLVRRGFSLGSHTDTHPILARLERDDARREIEVGKQRVEDLAGKHVALFAYPNGYPDRDYSAETVELVRDAGFEAAVSASPGAARIGCDPYQMPRFTPWDRHPARFTARMLHNLASVDPTYAHARGA